MNINDALDYLKNYDGKPITLMEVCGTHTASISENAIPSLLSKKISLVSGPGCPVCVTVSDYVDRLCQLALESNNVIVTFGDMIRVPGSKNALKDVKAQGADIRMVYTPLETIELAEKEPEKTFIFACVGFETTTPIYAVLVDTAIKKGINNIRLLTALKTMPAVIDALCENQNNIDGFIAPGHVAVITGEEIFEHLANKHHLPFVISGFKGEELVASIYALAKLQGKGEMKNLYKYAVGSTNKKAQSLVNKYFEPCDAAWRGLGIIKNSGMKLKEQYSHFDINSAELTNDYSHKNGCCCAEIISGTKKPQQCPLYKKICTPEDPKGACMVSNEGTCFNYYTNDRG